MSRIVRSSGEARAQLVIASALIAIALIAATVWLSYKGLLPV